MNTDYMDRGAATEVLRHSIGNVLRAAAQRAQRWSLNGNPAEDVTPHIYAKKAA